MKRFPELDLLRTVAVVGMILYHAAYDLASFYGYPFDMMHGGWLILERTVAVTFLALVGISFAISYNRTSKEKVWHKFIKRGLIVLACGYLVSIATYIVDPATYVRFGVLHLIGVSIFLLPFFIRFKRWNLLIAVAIIAAEQWSSMTILDTPWLLPLGFMPHFFETVDYFPLLPWFSVILIGVLIGQTFYVQHLSWRTRLPQRKARSQKLEAALVLPSRFALPIYLLHQPIIMGIFIIIFGRGH